MWVPVIAAGLCGLLGVGLVQLWRGRLTATAVDDQLVVDARFRTPGEPVDRDTAANLAIVALELLALVLAALVGLPMALGMTIELLYMTPPEEYELPQSQ